jgi:alkylation response protein AidB-like acyl-CoA dehydrogenase
MDFEDTPEEAAYRAKVRKWLEANAPKDAKAAAPGLSMAGEENAEDIQRGKAWQRKKADAGFAQIAWPKEWGGGGGSIVESIIFSEEENAAGLSALRSPFIVSFSICLPTVLTVADDATKKRFIGPAVRGEEIWCQLFSEPSGGSDMAAIRTRAVRDGDEWVINGQKVWNSGAHYADFGLLLVRTNPDVPKHKGLTMFWVDMKTPGIEARPIHQMSGASGFNEVFFSDVRIKDSQRVGPIDEGWKVSMVTLMNERAGGGGTGQHTVDNTLRLMRLAREIDGIDGGSALEDQALREKLADWYVQAEGLRLTGLRMLTALSRGETPGPEGSISKLVMSTIEQDLYHQAVEMQDQFGVIADPDTAFGQGLFQSGHLTVPGLRIAAGTDEILRNIIAERVLGLPTDIRVDKTVAFKDLPKSV